MQYFLFILGFVLLVKGADYLIEGGVKLASIFMVSPLFIGLTVASIGTSAPELAVSLNAALSSHPTISFGNILGSNIANIGLIIGVTALIFALPVKESTVRREIPYNLFVVVILLLLLRDDVFFGKIPMLSRIDGYILLLFFLVYVYYLYRMARSDRREFRINDEVENSKPTRKEILIAFVMTAGGILGIVFGSRLAVDNAVKIAEEIGVSETLISVTMVALGTSLPEAVTSFVAARRGHWDIAVGNVVGSNLFNILLVLGLTSAVTPIRFSLYALPDLYIVMGITCFFLVFFYTRRKISKKEGLILFLFYLAYIAYVLIRK